MSTLNRNPIQTHKKPLVIVTGCSGLIGYQLLHRLRESYEVVGFDRDGHPQPPKEVECICVDITDDESVGLGVDRVAYAHGSNVAAVVHLAAYYSFTGEPSPLYEKVTINGTKRLLNTLSAKGFNVERFIFSSTMLIHQPTQPGEPINEDSPLAADWPYPESKIETERIIHEHRGDIPACSLRIAGVYNEWAEAPTLSHQIKRIYERDMQSHVFPGNKDCGQSFVHIDDAIDSIVKTIERRNELPEEVAILIGEGETFGYEQMQNAIGQALHGKEWTTIRIPETVAKTGAWVQDKADVLPGVDEPFIKPWMIPHADDHFELDISRAQKLLGWSPTHRLIDYVPTMADKLREDPEAWYAHNGLAE